MPHQRWRCLRSYHHCCQSATRRRQVERRLLPTKGLTLPFVSYGGNSLIVNCMLLGMVLRTAGSLESERPQSHNTLKRVKA